MLDGLGIETGVSLDKVLAASRFIEPKLGHPLASRYAAAAADSGHAPTANHEDHEGHKDHKDL